MTNYVSDSNITSSGAIQDVELDSLKQLLSDLEATLAKRSSNEKEVNSFRKELDMFRKNLTSIRSRSDAVFKSLTKTTERNKLANEELDRLSDYGAELVAKVFFPSFCCSESLSSNCSTPLNFFTLCSQCSNRRSK